MYYLYIITHTIVNAKGKLRIWHYGIKKIIEHGNDDDTTACIFHKDTKDSGLKRFAHRQNFEMRFTAYSVEEREDLLFKMMR